MIRSVITKIVDYLGTLFLNGLLTLLPLMITFGFFSFSFRLLKNWLTPLQKLKIPYITAIPHSEIFLVIFAIFIAGFILKSFVFRSVLELFEKMIANLPVVRPIFTGIKQLVHAFSPSDTITFKKVVFVEFPRKGMYSIGFLTGEMPGQYAPQKDIVFYNIFIPTTPNPTTGYFLMVQKDDFIIADLTTQEAMALIISGGIIQPNRKK